MADCVKYDLLPIHEIISFGFTATPARNVRFAQLGYESSNIIEVLGSISFYIFVFTPFLFGISALAYFTKVHIKFHWVRKRIDPTHVKQGIIRFTLETFLELVLASFLIRGMFTV